MNMLELHVPITLTRIQVAILSRKSWTHDEVYAWEEKYTAETGGTPGGIMREFALLETMSLVSVTAYGYRLRPIAMGMREAYALLIHVIAVQELMYLDMKVDAELGESAKDNVVEWMDEEQFWDADTHE